MSFDQFRKYMKAFSIYLKNKLKIISMKNMFIAGWRAAILLVFIMFMISCNSGDEKNVMGELPQMAKSCTDKVEKVRMEQSKIDNNVKAMEYQKQIVELRTAARENIEKKFEEMKKPVKIPFKQEGYKGRYTIESVRLTDATYNVIKLEAVCEIRDTTLYNFVAYSKFFNTKGEELPGWAVLMSNRDSIVNGKVKLTGRYNHLDQLIDMQELKTFDNYYYRGHEIEE